MKYIMQFLTDIGRFLLTKWNRNFFFLLIAGYFVLKATKTVNDINIIKLILIAGVIIILNILKEIGNLIEKK
jgi:hypothetical protein